MKLRVAAAVGAAFMGSAAFASFTNGSFEAPALGNGVFGTTISDWSQLSTGLSGVWHTNSSYFTDPVPDGIQVGYINAGSIAQVSSDSIGLGHNEVSFWFGRRKDGFQGDATFTMTAGGTATNGLIVGGTSLASAGLSGPNQALGTWLMFTLSYDTVAGDANIGKSIGFQIVKTNGTQVDFDDVRANGSNNPVPEPFTMAGLGAGLLALLRKKNRKA